MMEASHQNAMWKERVKIAFERPNPLHMRWLICALVDSRTADEQKLLRSTCLCPICHRSIPPGPEVNSCLVQEGGSEDKTEHETLADRHPCVLPKPQNNNGHKKLVFSYTILQHFCHQIFQICVQQTRERGVVFLHLLLPEVCKISIVERMRWRKRENNILDNIQRLAIVVKNYIEGCEPENPNIRRLSPHCLHS
jgi:hypothetical protein